MKTQRLPCRYMKVPLAPWNMFVWQLKQIFLGQAGWANNIFAQCATHMVHSFLFLQCGSAFPGDLPTCFLPSFDSPPRATPWFYSWLCFLFLATHLHFSNIVLLPCSRAVPSLFLVVFLFLLAAYGLLFSPLALLLTTHRFL